MPANVTAAQWATFEAGDRVMVKHAGGDRKRFENRVGTVVRVQERWRDAWLPFVHVALDGSRRSFVLWPHELLDIGSGAGGEHAS